MSDYEGLFDQIEKALEYAGICIETQDVRPIRLAYENFKEWRDDLPSIGHVLNRVNDTELHPDIKSAILEANTPSFIKLANMVDKAKK